MADTYRLEQTGSYNALPSLQPFARSANFPACVSDRPGCVSPVVLPPKRSVWPGNSVSLRTFGNPLKHLWARTYETLASFAGSSLESFRLFLGRMGSGFRIGNRGRSFRPTCRLPGHSGNSDRQPLVIGTMKRRRFYEALTTALLAVLMTTGGFALAAPPEGNEPNKDDGGDGGGTLPNVSFQAFLEFH